jgi:hypothetical protein
VGKIRAALWNITEYPESSIGAQVKKEFQTKKKNSKLFQIQYHHDRENKKNHLFETIWFFFIGSEISINFC